MQKLPRWAEKRFSLECTEAGAVCTPPDEDVNGWDFLVEFSPPNFSGPPDRAPIFQKAYVQVKSTTQNAAQCKIKLSNLLKACHSSDPWFIVLIQKNEKSTETQTFCVHVWDELMQATLKASRKNYADGRPNHRRFLTVSFDSRSRVRENLVIWMQRCIGFDFHNYLRRKAQLREHLGHEEGYGTVNLILEAVSEDDIFKTFLGCETTSTKVVSFTYTCERFGIPDLTPTIYEEGGTVNVDPISAGPCTILIKGPPSERPLSLKGTIYPLMLPNISEREQITRFAAPPLDLILADNRNSIVELRAMPDRPYPIYFFQNYARLIKLLSNGRVQFCILIDNVETYEGHFSMKFNSSSDQFDMFLLITDSLARIAEWSSERDLHLRLSDIKSAMPDIGYFAQLISNHTFSIDADCPTYSGTISTITYYCYVKVGEWLFGATILRSVLSDKQNGTRRSINTSPPNVIDYFALLDGALEANEEVRRKYELAIGNHADDKEFVNFGNMIEFIKNSRKGAL